MAIAAIVQHDLDRPCFLALDIKGEPGAGIDARGNRDFRIGAHDEGAVRAHEAAVLAGGGKVGVKAHPVARAQRRGFRLRQRGATGQAETAGRKDGEEGTEVKCHGGLRRCHRVTTPRLWRQRSRAHFACQSGVNAFRSGQAAR